MRLWKKCAAESQLKWAAVIRAPDLFVDLRWKQAVPDFVFGVPNRIISRMSGINRARPYTCRDAVTA